MKINTVAFLLFLIQTQAFGIAYSTLDTLILR